MAREIVIKGDKVIIEVSSDIVISPWGVNHPTAVTTSAIISGPEVLAQYEKLRRDPNRFEKQEDGWFLDNFLGKVIAPPSRDTHHNWRDSGKYAESHGGWFEIWEWDTFIDRTRNNPAIVKCAEILELKLDDGYWSCTPYQGSSASAWCAYFGNGLVSYGVKDYGYYVRPVRSQ